MLDLQFQLLGLPPKLLDSTALLPLRVLDFPPQILGCLLQLLDSSIQPFGQLWRNDGHPLL